MKKIKNYIILILIISLGITSILLFRKTSFYSKERINSSGILEKVKSISELNTVEMYFNEIIDYKDAKYFHEIEIPFTKKSFIFSVKAKVKAGIDLSQLKEEDIKIEDKDISLNLPTPKITSIDILEYKSYDENDGLFNEVKNEDTFKALDKLKEDLDKQSKESDILEKSKENAKSSLTELLKAFEFENIEITFK